MALVAVSPKRNTGWGGRSPNKRCGAHPQEGRTIVRQGRSEFEVGDADPRMVLTKIARGSPGALDQQRRKRNRNGERTGTLRETVA